MSRYIDADEHLQKLGERRDTAIIWELNCNDEATKDRAQEAILIFNECISELINTPTADVVEVVRCKDCKYYENGLCANINFLSVKPNDYCSYAERIQEETE